jgi:hypothetical protein
MLIVVEACREGTSILRLRVLGLVAYALRLSFTIICASFAEADIYDTLTLSHTLQDSNNNYNDSPKY